MIDTKLVILAGFCAALNGLIIGMTASSSKNFDGEFKLLNNYLIYWSTINIDSDHGHLAQTPENLFEALKATVEALEKLLIHKVPKSVKGSKFSQKVSPGQSRIKLSEDFHEKFHFEDLSFNYKALDEEVSIDPINKEPISNISLIEKDNIEDDVEDFSLFSRDRVTPGLINLDEILEEVQERRSKTPSRMYEMTKTPEGASFMGDFQKFSSNGRIFRKSEKNLNISPVKPKTNKPLAPLEGVRFIRKMKKSRSSQGLSSLKLLDAEDLNTIGTKETRNNFEFYEDKNFKPLKDDWMD